MLHADMLHPDTPADKKGDPDAYAKWRVEHHDPDEVRGLSPDDLLQFFHDEWDEALEASEDIVEDAAEEDSASYLDEEIDTLHERLLRDELRMT